MPSFQIKLYQIGTRHIACPQHAMWHVQLTRRDQLLLRGPVAVNAKLAKIRKTALIPLRSPSRINPNPYN